MIPVNHSSEGYPGSERIEAWQDAMKRLGFESAPDAGSDFYGSIVSRVSPRGIVFSRLASSAQRVSLSLASAVGDTVIVLVLDGRGIVDGTSGEALSVHDLMVLPATATFDITFAAPFRLLLVHIPARAIELRLPVVGPSDFWRISGRSGLGYLLSRLLANVSEAIESLDSSEDLRPIDPALAEFLSAALSQRTADGPSAGISGHQAALFNRLCQRVEARLAEPDLTLADIARDENSSVRYMQKLFEMSGESFTNYLRRRRLERCRSDLVDPRHASLSISEICFRWGFNDAAHFSRSFRESFGKTPRRYRAEDRSSATRTDEQAQRGWPSDALGTAVRSRTSKTRADDETGRATLPSVVPTRHHIAADDKTVHWGYFSRNLKAVLHVNAGDIVTVEVVTQHASDDFARMIEGDAGIESIFHWTAEQKNVDRRGAGPMDASVYGRGAGEGFGVHILTGPIHVEDAEPGDVLEVRILDVLPRPSRSPDYAGRCFGSNAATFWGFHYSDLLTQPRPREVVTLYEFDLGKDRPCACAVYNYRWTPQTDPFGTLHKTIDYPGVPVDHATVQKNHGVLKGVEVPVRPHFGVIGVAPREEELIDSVPPSYFGGNIDNWRVGKGSSVYLPVSVPGALLSIGDPHASQGDSELCGTAIECSLTGVFQIVLYKKGTFDDAAFADLSYPIIETPTEWVLLGFSHPNYLAELGDKAQSKVYETASLDLAMKDAFRKMRRFLMTARGLSEDEALSLMSVAVDFGISQVVDGNWGVHAILRKELFRDGFPSRPSDVPSPTAA